MRITWYTYGLANKEQLSDVALKYFIHVAWFIDQYYPNNKVHGANMGPTRVLSAPDGPHVGHMNLSYQGISQWVIYMYSRDLFYQQRLI